VLEGARPGSSGKLWDPGVVANLSYRPLSGTLNSAPRLGLRSRRALGSLTATEQSWKTLREPGVVANQRLPSAGTDANLRHASTSCLTCRGRFRANEAVLGNTVSPRGCSKPQSTVRRHGRKSPPRVGLASDVPRSCNNGPGSSGKLLKTQGL